MAKALIASSPGGEWPSEAGCAPDLVERLDKTALMQKNARQRVEACRSNWSASTSRKVRSSPLLNIGCQTARRHSVNEIGVLSNCASDQTRDQFVSLSVDILVAISRNACWSSSPVAAW